MLSLQRRLTKKNQVLLGHRALPEVYTTKIPPQPSLSLHSPLPPSLPSLSLFVFLTVLLSTCPVTSSTNDFQNFLHRNLETLTTPKILPSPIQNQGSREGFVTLLYGDAFVLGVRVLGESIKKTNGVNLDRVVLISEGVTEEAALLLQADGWIVERVELLNNPNSHHPTNFWGVYTKLKIFNMTRYKKLIYLDADTIVVNDIRDLFSCSGFCATLRHSEKFNTGVMVVEPSAQVFADMMKNIEVFPSYTGGDQGFLNEYYGDFVNAKLFDSKLSTSERGKEEPIPKMERLPTIYNADVGLYMLANKWMVDESLLKVIHYTLGPLKPWDWWTEWLVAPVTQWQKLRFELPDSIPGSGGGSDPSLWSYMWILFLFPLIVTTFLYRGLLLELFGEVSSYLKDGQILNKGRKLKAGYAPFPSFFNAIGVSACFCIGFVSLGTAFTLVPSQVRPWTGLLLVYEWTFFLFAAIYGNFLSLMRSWGRRNAEKEEVDLKHSSSTKGHSREWTKWDTSTFFYSLSMALMAIGVPSLPYALGVTALFGRLGLFVVGGVFGSVLFTVLSQRLAARWYGMGREDWAQRHGNTLCDL